MTNKALNSEDKSGYFKELGIAANLCTGDCAKQLDFCSTSLWWNYLPFH